MDLKNLEGPRQIKVEASEVTLIQKYLDNLQTVGEDENTTTVIVQGEDGDNVGIDEGGTYFVDEEGRYYYQATPDSQPVLTTVDQIPQEEETVEGEALLNNEEFQTVAIIPSETGSGEVRYVLIVQNSEEEVKQVEKVPEDSQENDITVYDFNEAEEIEQIEEDESDYEEEKKNILKVKKTQSSSRKHVCQYCDYTSPRRYLLSRHLKSHSEDRPFKCGVCERGFKTTISLQNHVNTHTGVKPYTCKYCQTAFTTSGELVRHVRYKHTHEKPHKCSECDYASVELSKLKRHIRCHTGERPFQCPHCTYASTDTFKLKRHLRTHTGEKPYVCELCNLGFTQSNTLKSHKLRHNISQKPIYRCELCPATCGRKTDLRIHVQKLHTSEIPLSCKRCNKSFPDRYSYKLHSKTHEGEKCYKCDVCPYASISQRHLASHMLKHTDEKPFQCELCEQSFRQKQLLKRHLNLHHNPSYVRAPPKEKTHECHQCGRTFAHKGNLIRHMESHDPDPKVLEKALALKLGRQKRVRFIDAERTRFVEIKPKQERCPDEEYEEEEVDEEDEVLDEEEEVVLTEQNFDADQVVVTEGDGQQYVVLEVIQMADGEDDEEGQLEVPEVDPTEVEEFGKLGPFTVASASNDPPSRKLERSKRGQPLLTKIKVENDVDSCFGFDDGDEEDD